jgi:DNA-binding MarR family transcriptional regulator
MNTKKSEVSNKLSDLMDIDKDIHEPARLMILSYLYVIESADFVFLRGQTELTWGNLSSHISKLEEKLYVVVEKEFIRKKPRTMVKITEKGRQALLNYKEKMKKILG